MFIAFAIVPFYARRCGAGELIIAVNAAQGQIFEDLGIHEVWVWKNGREKTSVVEDSSNNGVA